MVVEGEKAVMEVEIVGPTTTALVSEGGGVERGKGLRRRAGAVSVIPIVCSPPPVEAGNTTVDGTAVR